MHTHSKTYLHNFKDGVNDPAGLRWQGWPWALLDFGPGLELCPRTAALRPHLRLLLPARAYTYCRNDLREDAYARFN
jgi:hypothetical protein